MSKYGCLLFGILISLTACQPKQSVISGSFEPSQQDTLLLLSHSTPAEIDTVILDHNGSFKIKKELSTPAFYDVRMGSQQVTLVVHPQSKIKISGHTQDLLGSFQVEGSEESAQIFALNQRMRRSLFVKDSLDLLYQRILHLPKNEIVRQKLIEDYTLEINKLREFNVEFVRQNKTSLASLYALYQQVSAQTYVFSQEEDLQYFQMVDSALYKLYPKMSLVNMLHRNVQEMSSQLRQKRLEEMISGLGQSATDFSAQDSDGKNLTLSSLRGKYVLLVFWASWNPASRLLNKDLSSLYNQFKDRNFEIFQVSFDYTYASWIQAISDDQLTGTQVWEPKGTASATASLYQVETLPLQVLVDPEGMIIAKQLKQEALIKKLEDLLSK